MIMASSGGKRLLRSAEKIRKAREKKERSFAEKALGTLGEAAKDVGRFVTDEDDLTGLGLNNKSTKALADAITDPGKSLKKFTKSQTKRELKKAGSVDPTEGLEIAGKAIFHTGKAFYDRPGKTLSSTAKSVPEIAAGLIPGLAMTVADPVRVAKEVGKDYSRRYGVLKEKGGGRKFEHRVQEEGAIPELLDVAGAGAVVGRAGTVAARTGALGKGAKRVATEERPKLRTAPGKTRTQRKAKNLIIAAGQTKLDKSRSKAQIKRARKAERGEKSLRPEDTAGIESGVVTPRTKTGGRLARARRFDDEQGRARVRMRREDRDEITKGSRKSEAKLSKAERRGFAYAMMGLVPLKGTKAQKLAALDRRATNIERDRDGMEITGRRRKKYNDELRLIDYLKKNVEKVFTERLARVVEVEKARERRLAKDDPALADQQAELARIGPQARTLGVIRREGESPAEYRKRVVGEARKDVKRARRKHEQARKEEAFVEGRSGALAEAARRAIQLGRITDDRGRRVDLTQLQGDRLLRAQAKTRDAKRELGLAQAALREAKRDGDVPAAKRGSEPVEDFKARAAAAREREGLPEPGYFKNEGGLFEERRADYALGTGSQGVTRGPKRRTYNAFDTGQIDTRMEVFHQGLAKNIKRKHQWNFVIGNLEDNAVRKVRDLDGNVVDLSEGRSLTDLVNIVDNTALDSADYRAVQVGKIRNEAKRQDDSTTPDFEGDVAQEVGKAVESNAKTIADARRLITDPKQVTNDNGWFLVPKEIVKRQADVRFQSPVGRFVRKYAKGIPSKLILGTNPSWAILQVFNNQLLAHLGGVGWVDQAKSAAYFRRLAKTDPELRKEIDAYIGAMPFEAEMHTAKLGGTVDWGWVNWMREIKKTPLAQTVGRNNPLDLLFKMDHKNNAIHRRAVAYDFLKGKAYKEMGESVTGFMTQMNRLKYSKTLGPKQMVDLLKQPEVLDEMARHVDDLMGNYTRYSPLERRLLEQNVLFYGFVRFSLRFTFWTLPTKHPIIANIATNLSRLHEKETRKLLGIGQDDPLFPGTLASFYFRDKKGKLQELPLLRLNPTQNVLTSGDAVKAALLSMPPAYLALLNQGFDKDLFTGKAHKLRGESQARETKQNRKEYPALDPASFFEDSFLELFSAYRTAEKIRFRGRPQGADSIPFINERPTKFKDEDLKADIEASVKEESKRPVGRYLLENLVVPLPRPSRDDELAQQLAEALDGTSKSKREKKGPKSFSEYVQSGPSSQPKKKAKKKSGPKSFREYVQEQSR